MKQKTKEHLYRFIKNFNSIECWEFQGWIHPISGYGIIKLNRKRFFAHRYSFEVHYGIFDYSLKICHKCDNTRCVNPNHLFIGTQKDNMQDKVSKNRQNQKETHHNVKLTTEEVKEIRKACSSKIFSHSRIASFFGVRRETISKIHQGIRWK